MDSVLIVHAHPEPRSFSSTLARTAREDLTAAGHSVEFSDLYALGFDPVSDRRNFTTTADPAYLEPQVEEVHANKHDGFAPVLEAEMRKLERAELLIFSFPLWWFGMPAVLKGRVDRVFAYGRFYGGGRWYDRAPSFGKRALVVTTTGSGEEFFSGRSVHPPFEQVLAPIQHGIFWFNGYRPLTPFVAWAAGRVGDAERQQYLARWRERLAHLFDEEPASRPTLEQFDPETYADLRQRFVVSVTRVRPADDAYRSSVPAEIARVQELRRAGLVLDAWFAPPAAEPWRGFLLFRARDRAEVEAACASLPLADYLKFEFDHVT